MKKIVLCMLSLLMVFTVVGCKQDEKTDETTNVKPNKEVEKEDEGTKSEVTADNFMSFPETKAKSFKYKITNSSKGEGCIIEKCTSKDNVIRVPDKIEGKPVIAIDKFALSKLDNCEAVVLPDTVQWIDEGAISGNENLKYLYLGKGLKDVGIKALSDNRVLEEVEFPDGIERLGSEVLTQCYAIKKVVIPASVTDVTSSFMDSLPKTSGVEIYAPKGSEAEKAALNANLKVVN